MSVRPRAAVALAASAIALVGTSCSASAPGAAPAPPSPTPAAVVVPAAAPAWLDVPIDTGYANPVSSRGKGTGPLVEEDVLVGADNVLPRMFYFACERPTTLVFRLDGRVSHRAACDRMDGWGSLFVDPGLHTVTVRPAEAGVAWKSAVVRTDESISRWDASPVGQWMSRARQYLAAH